MCGEIERGVELVDRFILIQIDDIFDERFVEMVFYFIDDKVESVFKRRDDGMLVVPQSIIMSFRVKRNKPAVKSLTVGL